MNLLDQILQIVLESGKSPHELLKNNLDKLNDNFADELRTWASDKLSKAQLEEKRKIVLFIAVFSQFMLHFSLGSQASNTEIAISGYKVLQEVLIPKDIPQDWAWIQHELGCAYNRRIRGEAGENLELAIKAFKLALKDRTREADNKLWARTQNNLGITYCHRIRGDKDDNLKKAINAFNSALKVYTPNEYPNEWAWTKNEIGYAYLNKENGDKADNLKQAINAFNSSLKVYTREDYLDDWARTQNNLGNAYLKTEKIEEAINAFKSVLEVVDDNHIIQRAITRNNLGNAYLQRTQGNKEENLELAFNAFSSNLQVYNREDFPEELAITQGYIGYIKKCTNKHEEAYKAFKIAIDITESMRSEIIYGSDIEADKQKLAEKSNAYYQSIIEVCLQLGLKQPEYFARAIEYAEHSKARNLVELLDNKSLYPQKELYLKYNFNEEADREEIYKSHCKKLDNYRSKISSLQRQKEGKEALIKIAQESKQSTNNIEEAIDSINENLNDLRQKISEILHKINKIDPDFKFTQQVSKICFNEIQSLIKEKTAIIEWYITNNKIITFIITPNKNQQTEQSLIVLTSSPKDLYELEKSCKEYLRMYYASEQKKEWQSKLTNCLKEFAKLLHIESILKLIPNTCNRLILVPHRFLHLLPLHALPVDGQKYECVLDKFQGGVGYAPSCQLLQRSQRLQRAEFSNLFAIKNPKNALRSLHNAELEVDVIRSFFDSEGVDVLENEKAGEAAFKESQKLHSFHCCHFACHGEFNPASPLESALQLAKDKEHEDGRLTLAEIFGLTLDKCRLVTLSACETAMVDPDNISDEYIGLPSGFIVAGSPSVVASLWAADDKSTAILMIKFYENLRKHREKFPQLEEGAVAIALNQAQLWLRDLTKAKWNQWIEESSLGFTCKMSLPTYFPSQAQGEEQPFRKPDHWAAFCAIGQ